jgi:hypothetical protein
MTERCQHADTVASFLLGALSEEGRAGFETHLASCPTCRDDAVALGAVVDLLAAAAPQVAPPSRLRERVMATVHAEAELLHAAGPSADRPRSAPRRRRFPGGLPLQRPLALAGAAALVVAGFAGFGLRALTDSNPASPTRTVQAQVTPAAAPHGSARVVVRGGVATLQVSGMPLPPRGHVYEVWLVRPGVAAPAPTDALFSVDRLGSGRVALPSVRGVQAVLVTAEPAGGSLAPTQKPFISATL